jgi:hypothetical protein
MLDTGIARKDVQAAELVHHTPDQGLGLGNVADVGLQRHRPVTVAANVGDQGLG